MNEILVDLVLDQVLFVGLCDDDVLDPDTAVRLQEHIVAALEGLSPADAEVFRELTRRRIARVGGASPEGIELATLLDDLAPVDDHA